ncbi:hypothetical protein [Streptomyces violaceus]|uniref:hypothetical protein n=1 Tax=Streptomyces violaceus TaxID=1936 RepID=UPI0039A67794
MTARCVAWRRRAVWTSYATKRANGSTVGGPPTANRHYLFCRCCASSLPVDSEVVEQWADRIAADTGFAAVEHRVELTGLCTDCHTTEDQEGVPPCRWEPEHQDSPGRARSRAS